MLEEHKKTYPTFLSTKVNWIKQYVGNLEHLLDIDFNKAEINVVRSENGNGSFI
ncbi:hypothetical protein FC24_GL000351 [Loigolactobacillus rennini DSM 20253]|uniref:Uncharacterized protein n=1 Tax=Loigolactobacillus rennini DSM 20253 TaxID=1423796 RepID=A0A0R2DFV8_9LACO|nr:hypothetical protein FC24_GL000351 [Loigolactobacillus rennini DSM 20253]